MSSILLPVLAEQSTFPPRLAIILLTVTFSGIVWFIKAVKSGRAKEALSDGISGAKQGAKAVGFDKFFKIVLMLCAIGVALALLSMAFSGK